jgi:uncharacterized protein YjhX (UPF0386 family)
MLSNLSRHAVRIFHHLAKSNATSPVRQPLKAIVIVFCWAGGFAFPFRRADCLRVMAIITSNLGFVRIC